MELLRKINSAQYNTIDELEKEIPRFVIKDLIDKHIIVEAESHYYNTNILPEIKCEYPLTSLVIELTNICNLNCIHCYGKFGTPRKKKIISLDDVINLKSELDRLHTMEVRLSGGECFLNPDFEDIAIFFLQNGFRVGIYTNGVETQKIKSFLERTRGYHFYVAISLDGEENYHNIIRGNERAFANTIATMKELKKYENVEVLVETAISKINIHNVKAVETMVRSEFPKFEHMMFLISPVKGCSVSFGYEDITKMKKICDNVFEDYYSKLSDRYLFKHKSFRCHGGVINGVLTSDGNVKCCPIAEDEIFIMGNIKERALSSIWEHPEGDTLNFRKEFAKSSPQCKRCIYKRKCGNKNCRVEAKLLTGDWRNANPYTCMAVKGKYNIKENLDEKLQKNS
ncbi:MAG: radical SAM protein [Lachnospiraceae bacterium]|nr:radical SAM protein [Lachnospiraceae bacterium]